MNEEMREAFEQAFADFEAMNDAELAGVLEDNAYDGLYHNIAKMTAGTKTRLVQRAEEECAEENTFAIKFRMM